MAIEDLDLEFEDEEEGVKSDALDVDVDLSFAASPEDEMAQRTGGVRVKPTPKAGAPKPKPQPTNPKVSNIESARAKAGAPKASPKPRPQAKPASQAVAEPTYVQGVNPAISNEVQELRAEIQALKAQMQSIEHQADIRVAVAEAEKEFLVEYVSNAKVLDHQVTQILQRINTKVPQLKGEVQTIKKYMQEFLKKSAPKKKGEG